MQIHGAGIVSFEGSGCFEGLRRLNYTVRVSARSTPDGLGNRLIDPSVAANGAGPIRRRTRVGGLLSFYHREAA